MRVLLVAEQLARPAPGGIGTYVRGLVAGLDGGAEVSLVGGRGLAAVDGAEMVRSRLPGAVLTRAWDHGLVPAPRTGFDVVHGASLAAPPSTAAPLAVAVHDLAWRALPEAFPPRGRRWHDAALRRAVERADVLVSPTSSTADRLIEAGARRVEVPVPMYGCDHLPPADDAAAAEVLAGLGVTGPYLLTVGTREPRKNLPRLMEAYGRARPRLPEPWPLVVVGPVGWGGVLLGRGGPPLPEGVVLAGEVPGGVLAALYAGARCLAFVPLLEGFGLPAVEAMAAGTPVVASPMPSTGEAAWVVDPLDIGAIATALVGAATDDRRRAELAEAGRDRARPFTWVAAAAAHLDLWKSL
jgi:glycosyltransferase involved in cell wall biosynthesis